MNCHHNGKELSNMNSFETLSKRNNFKIFPRKKFNERYVS